MKGAFNFGNRAQPGAPLLSDYLSNLVKGRLWLQVLIGVFLGILIGILIGPATGWVEPRLASMIGNWLTLPGQLFQTLIQMISPPLIFASMICGLAASENLEQLRRIGLRAVSYFVVTMAAAIAIGLWIVLQEIPLK